MEDITRQASNEDIVLKLWRELSIVETSYSTIRFLGIQYNGCRMTETSIQQSLEAEQFVHACELPGHVRSGCSEPVRYGMAYEKGKSERNATEDADTVDACQHIANEAGVIEICPSGLSHTPIDSNRTDICYSDTGNNAAIPKNGILRDVSIHKADTLNCVVHFGHGGEQKTIIYTSKDSNLLKEHCRKLCTEAQTQTKSIARTKGELKVCNSDSGVIDSSTDLTAKTDDVPKTSQETTVSSIEVSELEYPMDCIIKERILQKKKRPKKKFNFSQLLNCARS